MTCSSTLISNCPPRGVSSACSVLGSVGRKSLPGYRSCWRYPKRSIPSGAASGQALHWSSISLSSGGEENTVVVLKGSGDALRSIQPSAQNSSRCAAKSASAILLSSACDHRTSETSTHRSIDTNIGEAKAISSSSGCAVFTRASKPRIDDSIASLSPSKSVVAGNQIGRSGLSRANVG